MRRLCIFLNLISLLAGVICLSLIVSTVIFGCVVLSLFAIGYKPESFALMTGIFSFCVVSIFGGCLLLAWRSGGKELVFEEEKSRGQSFLLWETSAFLLFFLLFLVSFHTDLDLPFLIGLCLPVAALIPAAAFPFRSCRSKFWKKIRLCGFLAAVFLWLFGSVLVGRGGKSISSQGGDPAGFPRSVQWIGRAWVPAGASGIDLQGSSTCCSWSCQVSEQDFMKFKAKCPFEFLKVEKPRDIMDKGPFPYYLYDNQRLDGGGVVLRYDAVNQKMTGSYSHH